MLYVLLRVAVLKTVIERVAFWLLVFKPRRDDFVGKVVLLEHLRRNSDVLKYIAPTASSARWRRRRAYLDREQADDSGSKLRR